MAPSVAMAKWADGNFACCTCAEWPSAPRRINVHALSSSVIEAQRRSDQRIFYLLLPAATVLPLDRSRHAALYSGQTPQETRGSQKDGNRKDEAEEREPLTRGEFALRTCHRRPSPTDKKGVCRRTIWKLPSEASQGALAPTTHSSPPAHHLPSARLSFYKRA